MPGFNPQTLAYLQRYHANQNPYGGISAFGQGMSIGGSVASAIGSFFAIRDTQNQAKSNALAFEFQDSMSMLNASAATREAEGILEAGRREIGQIGLRYAQEKASQRTSTAGAGVVVGTGSSAEVLASIELAKKLDTFELNLGTVARAHQSRIAGANARNDSILARVSARNSLRTARSVVPAVGAITSLVGSAGTVASQWVADSRADLYYRSRF